MNPIEEQQQIIDQLYRIVRGSCPEATTAAKCRFEYERFDDGSASVGETFHYLQNGKEVSAALSHAIAFPVMDLVQELHGKMRAHTGGDWNAFTLFVNEDGTVTTKFEYPKVDAD